jgi:hypothetical protein
MWATKCVCVLEHSVCKANYIREIKRDLLDVLNVLKFNLNFEAESRLNNI